MAVQQNLGNGAGASLCGQLCSALRVLPIKEDPSHLRPMLQKDLKVFLNTFLMLIAVRLPKGKGLRPMYRTTEGEISVILELSVLLFPVYVIQVSVKLYNYQLSCASPLWV